MSVSIMNDAWRTYQIKAVSANSDATKILECLASSDMGALELWGIWTKRLQRSDEVLSLIIVEETHLER